MSQGRCVIGPLCHRHTVWSVCHRAVLSQRFYVSQAHCMVCVSQGRSVTAVLCVTGTLYGLCVTEPFCHSGSMYHRHTVWSVCHRAVLSQRFYVSQAHCMVCVSQGRSVTALKASFIGLLLQYWLILKTRNFYFFVFISSSVYRLYWWIS